ncbi:hypothetical protein SH661x_001759 [Planctomicrobium sp. SH661]|uniref:hypothetical protein n=1 Tax=Planctomicrobium sp. SH661 TaxID=3448124 RepID=UPI003F5C77D5
MTTQVDADPSPPTLPEEASSRLMRMLESVRLEKAETPNNEPAAQTNLCPQCGSEEPWGNSSWCPECGYYPKLGRAMTPVEIDPNFGQFQPRSLIWMVWAGAGVFVLTALCVVLCFLLPDPDDRIPIGRVQFAAGVTLMMVAQIWAYIVASHNADAIPFSAIFVEPVQLWMTVFRKMPESRRVVYCAIWSLAIVILAVAVTGVDVEGIFGKTKKKKKANLMKSMVKAISAAEGASAFGNTNGGDGEEEEEEPEPESGLGGGLRKGGPPANGDIASAMQDFAGSAGADGYAAQAGAAAGGGNLSGTSSSGSNGSGMNSLNALSGDQITKSIEELAKASPEEMLKKVPPSPSGQPRNQHGRYVVFGYLTNPAGEIKSLLLAEVASNRARFAGKMTLDELDSSAREELQGTLDRIRSSRSVLKTPYQARWVRPMVHVDVAHGGRTPEGHLRDGFLMNVDDSLLNKSPQEGPAERP